MTNSNENEESLFDKSFREGSRARVEGRFNDAINLFKVSLSHCSKKDFKRIGVVCGMLGNVSRKGGDLASAEKYSKTATKHLPQSQLASIGMFHTLWDQGKRKEALEEIVRLVSLRDSDHYRELLGQGFGDDLAPDVRSLADEARRILDEYGNS